MGLGSDHAPGNEHDGRAELLKELKAIISANSKLKELISRYEVPSNSGAELAGGDVETLAARAEAEKSLLGDLRKLQEDIRACGVKIESQISDISARNDQLLAIVEALRENEELFRVLANTTLIAIFLVQRNKFIYANPAAQKIMGYSREELSTMNFWEPIHPEFRDQIEEYGLSLHSKPVPGRFEVKYVKKTGEEGWAVLTIAPVMYKGEIAGVVSGVDITERKRAEDALQESEEKFRVLSETSPAAIFLYQGDVLIYANEAAERFTGYTREEMLKKNYWDMVHPRYKEMVKKIGIARQSGKQVPTRYEVQYITRSREVRWAEFAAGMIEYRRKPAGIVIAFDITDRKQAEVALRESKAQAEMYVDLMGHDINNLNQIAMGYLELAMEHLEPDQKSMEYLSKPIEALGKSSKLIEKVKKLQLMRSGQLEPISVDVRAVIEEVIKIYSDIPGRDITINYAPSPAIVKADELLIEIFSNLVLNAIKHSPCDKPLIIDIGTSRISRAQKDYYKITVDDNGPGIPDEKKVSIFGRFSKGSNRIKGSGLGLYLVKSLADSYGGEVWAENRVFFDHTRGSRFVVLLPAAGE
jgi:PAS domain S-box-containing protein